MMWRSMDPQHPGVRRRDRRAACASVIRGPLRRDGRHRRRDARAARARTICSSSCPTTASRRGGASFNLNSWLRDSGYLTRRPRLGSGCAGLVRRHRLVAHARVRPRAERPVHQPAGTRGVRHRRSGAARRAADGDRRRSCCRRSIPPPASRRSRSVFRREDVYSSAGNDDIAPDLDRRLRERHARVGRVGARRLSRRRDQRTTRSAWSGDHCMDPETVPGILLTSRPLKKPAATLQALAPAILAEFGMDSWAIGFPVESRRQRDEGCMFGSGLKLDKALRREGEAVRRPRGLFVGGGVHHARAREGVREARGSDSEQEIKKKLKGLGYIS